MQSSGLNMQPKGRALNRDILLCFSVVWKAKARTRPGDLSLVTLQMKQYLFLPREFMLWGRLAG